jgi:hypothetical protein
MAGREDFGATGICKKAGMKRRVLIILAALAVLPVSPCVLAAGAAIAWIFR